MPPLFTKSLAESLNQKCALDVSEGCDGDAVQPGQIVIAPGGRQMGVQQDPRGLRLYVNDDPPENSCRPSVDYLFRSVAEEYRAAVLAVILTGMGNDGLKGCRLLKREGAQIITQDEPSCVVYGMPKGPADEGLSDVIAPLDSIAAEITRCVGRRVAACR